MFTYSNTDLAIIYTRHLRELLSPNEMGKLMPLIEWQIQLEIAELDERYEDCYNIKEVIDSFELTSIK